MSSHEMFLNGLLSKRLRITIQDGRIIEGDLMCTDNGCNIVINDCSEYLTQKDLDEKERNPKSQSANVRTLPMAIIPGEQVCRIIVNEDRLPKDVLQYINGECEQVEKNIDSVIANNEDARNL